MRSEQNSQLDLATGLERSLQFLDSSHASTVSLGRW
jgi:hypothetical protein